MEEKQVKVKGGRKRKNLVKFYLNDEEYQKLCENAATFGRDKSKYLRLVIGWIAPIESPVIPKNAEAYAAIKDDIRCARMYSEQAKFLCKYGLETKDDLIHHALKVDPQIKELCKERRALWNKIRWMKDSEKMQPIREEIYAISAKIKPLRKEQKMCKDIYERSTAVARTVEQIEFPKPPEKAKQQTRNHGWGSR